jgi:hypothetical protein
MCYKSHNSRASGLLEKKPSKSHKINDSNTRLTTPCYVAERLKTGHEKPKRLFMPTFLRQNLNQLQRTFLWLCPIL